MDDDEDTCGVAAPAKSASAATASTGLPPTCGKCRAAPAQAYSLNTPYCLDCFVASVKYRIRGNLVAARVSPDKRMWESFLLHYTATPTSAALLHFLHDAIHFGKSRLFVRPVVAFVDESCLSESAPKATVDAVTEIVTKKYGFEHFVVAPLSDVMAILPPDIRQDATTVPELLRARTTGKNRGGGTTNREDLLAHLRTFLLSHVAQEHGCVAVMRSDNTADAVADAVFAATVAGRGGSLGYTSALIDRRPAVPHTRPLKDVTRKDLALACHFLNIPHIVSEEDVDAAARTSSTSINALTKNFLASLSAQPGNSHTYSTIVSTADKLAETLGDPEETGSGSSSSSNNNSNNNNNNNNGVRNPCLLCGTPIFLHRLNGGGYGGEGEDASKAPSKFCRPCRQQFNL